LEKLQSAINWFEIPATDFDRVEAAGGTIVSGKKQIFPEIGYFAIIVDTEGNRVYLHSMN